MTSSFAKRSESPRKRIAPIVKGPIRCHKCQLVCQDAAQYLGHSCEEQRALNDPHSRRLMENFANGTIGRSIR
jgi:hypothetical protein